MHVVGRASTLVPAAGDLFAHDVYDDNWSRSTHASFSQRPSAGVFALRDALRNFSVSSIERPRSRCGSVWNNF
jgi:hypothetical protein